MLSQILAPQRPSSRRRHSTFSGNQENIERLKERLQHVATLTLEGLEQFQETPAFLTGAGILKVATAEKRAPISLGLFAINGWCDWTYIVDLDQNTFEVSGDLHK